MGLTKRRSGADPWDIVLGRGRQTKGPDSGMAQLVVWRLEADLVS